MLDTASGKPAEGVKIDFSVLEGSAYRLIKTVHTNADGRNAEPLLTAETMKVGQYELVFHIGEYFTKLGTVLPNPPFLEKAVIQFGMADATSHYHVPLLASLWSYTTYRGSYRFRDPGDGRRDDDLPQNVVVFDLRPAACLDAWTVGDRGRGPSGHDADQRDGSCGFRSKVRRHFRELAVGCRTGEGEVAVCQSR